jgi:Holliday junction resolvasome RuvABC endonuclease subunit
MQPISIKRVYDEHNSFSHLELIQGNSCIKISLASSVLDIQKKQYKWEELKAAVEGHISAAQSENLTPDDYVKNFISIHKYLDSTPEDQKDE